MKTCLASILIVITITLSAKCADEANQKPNVLFIITDDLSVTLHAFSRDGIITPNIDKLARPGKGFYKGILPGFSFAVLGSSIRTERFRYHICVQQNEGSVLAEELYDLSQDIHQVENRISDKGLNRLNETLRKELLKRTKQ